MKYYVYILQSLNNGQFYIGQTQNLEKRIFEHNSGKSNFTSKNKPWNLVWYTELKTRSESYKLEQEMKHFKQRIKIIKYISENPCVSGSKNLQISNLLDFRESS